MFTPPLQIAWLYVLHSGLRNFIDSIKHVSGKISVTHTAKSFKNSFQGICSGAE